MISNQTRAVHLFDFEITPMISDQTAFHSVQLPLCHSRKYPYSPPPHRRDWKFQGMGGGGFKDPGISRGGRGVVSMNFVFFQTGLNFHTVVCQVSLFAFCFLSSEREKINLANLGPVYMEVGDPR